MSTNETTTPAQVSKKEPMMTQYVFESREEALQHAPKHDEKKRWRLYCIQDHNKKTWYVYERFTVTAIGRVYEHLGVKAILETQTTVQPSIQDLLSALTPAERSQLLKQFKV